MIHLSQLLDGEPRVSRIEKNINIVHEFLIAPSSESYIYHIAGERPRGS